MAGCCRARAAAAPGPAGAGVVRWSRRRGGGGGRGLVAVAAGLVAGQLRLPEGGEPVQGVGDGTGGPAQDPADRVRGEVGVRVPGEMGGDEVAQLPGAGRRAGRAAWLASARGGLEEAAALGGGGADGVHRGQRGGGVPAVEHLRGLGSGGGHLAQQHRCLTSRRISVRRRRLRLAVRRRRGCVFPAAGPSAAGPSGMPASGAAFASGAPSSAWAGVVSSAPGVPVTVLSAAAGSGVLPSASSGAGPLPGAGRLASPSAGAGGPAGGSAVPAGSVSSAPAGAVAGAGDAAWGAGCQVAGAVVRPLRAPGVRVARPLVSRAASSWPATIRLVPAAVAIWAAVAPGAAVSAAQTAAAGPSAGGRRLGRAAGTRPCARRCAAR